MYTPPGYEESGESYPVLWCLIGFTGSGEMAVTGNHWSPGLAARLDRLIAEGCPPVIVAFPDCFTRWGGSQYVNSSAFGNYEDYVCDELVPFVEERYRVRPNSRGVVGKSSGGYGAVRLPMKRPGLFRAAASHSGDMGFAMVYTPGFPSTCARVAAAGSLAKWVETFESSEKRGDHDVINTLAMAAAYSPDPDAEFGFALPFDLKTGELKPDIWRKWQDNDPVNMVDTHQEGLKALDLLFLDCGSEDEFNIHLGLRLFVKRLSALGIDHEVEEFKDNHRSISYRYDVSIPKLARVLSEDSRAAEFLKS